MMLQLLPYLFPYFVSLAVSTFVGVMSWRRKVPGTNAYAVSAWLQASWTFGYILELGTPTLEGKIFWDDFQYIGTVLWPTALLIFAYQFSRQSELGSRRMWVQYSMIPLVILILVATNPLHGLMRTDATVVLSKPFDILEYKFTAAVYIMVVYLYTMTLATLWVLSRTWLQTRGVFRHQIAIIFIGISIPAIGGVFTLSGAVELVGQRDITPFTFALSNLVVAWGLLRHRLFNLVPIARDAVIENMPSAVIVLGTDNIIVDVNPAGRRYAVGESERLIGQHFDVAFPLFSNLLNAAASTITVTGGEEEPTTHYEATRSHLTNEQKQIIGNLVVIRDVTDEVRAQQMIQKRSDELATANAELKIAWEAAKEADAIKSRFLASVSHELRTPLNAVLNFTEFVFLEMLGPINDQQKDALGKGLKSGRDLLALINDVLDITKIESGMMKLYVQDDVDPTEILAEVLVTAASLLHEKPIQLIQDIDGDLPLMVGDKRRMKQILLNLVSNACKFTEEGSITVSAKFKRPDTLLFAVIDTGPGISQADQNLVFEPFQQSQAGFHHTGGTGLGLAISKRLVEAHAGELWVESEPGNGAAFYVRLPLRAPDLVEKLKTRGNIHV